MTEKKDISGGTRNYTEYFISIPMLDDFIKQHVGRGEKTDTRADVADILFAKTEYRRKKRADRMRAYNRAKKSGKVIRVPSELATSLVFQIPDQPRVEPEKLLASWAPKNLDRVHLTSRDADYGEIEVITEASKNLVDERKFSIASRYVSVYVDKVRFFQKGKDEYSVSDGEYIRIEVPSLLHGAVVLPVEQSTGQVLLVTQYRHSAQRFLTDCPRGFGMTGADQNEFHTAKRELAEETGHVPVKTTEGVEKLYLLKDSYTDTGKLWEKPALFLAYVDRDSFTDHLNEYNPAMEDPVWVNLPGFVKALYARSPVQLARDEYEFAREPRHLRRMRPRTPISRGLLSIEDGFTLQAGLLALPRLKERFGL